MSSTHFRLSATLRDPAAPTPQSLRRAGTIPAIMYSRGTPATPLAINLHEFEQLARVSSSSQLIEIAVGSAPPVRALVSDIQRDAVSDRVIHIDFHRVSETERMHAKVPFHFEGVAPAVKELGGTLVRVLNELKVECLPQHLPEFIIVDLTRLRTFADVIEVKDLSVPDSVEVLERPDAVVVKATEVRQEVVVETPTETTTPEPEVVGKAAKGGEKKEEAVAEEGKKE